VQKEYPRFEAPEWGRRIRDVIGDIIRNRRRRAFEQERKDHPDVVSRKRGRPSKTNALNKRQRITSAGADGEESG